MTALDTRALQTMTLDRRPCPTVPHDFRIIVSESAFDRMVARGGQDVTREVGGFLVGEVLSDDSGPYIVVETTIDALNAEEKGAELTITHATWDHVHKQMDEVHKGKRILGWYHTHPGFGIFLSDRDQFIHQSFFNLPFQVALVYDPKTREHGAFSWRDNQTQRVRRYWVAGRETTWDGEERPAPPGNVTALPLQPAPPPPEVVPTQPEQPVSVHWIVAIALLAVVLAGVFGWRAGGQSAATAYRAELAVLQQKAAEQATRDLNRDLVRLVTASVGQAPTKQLKTATARLETALKALSHVSEGPRRTAALDAVREAQSAVLRIKVARETLDQKLAQWEREATQRSVPEALTELSEGLGRLYLARARAAAEGGKKKEAVLLLEQAARLDPAHREIYEAARAAVLEGGAR